MIINYNGFIKNNESVDDLYDISHFNIPKNPHLDKKPEEVEKEYYKELGRKGKLGHYLKEHGKEFTFGILRIVFEDALAYKRRRIIKKGTFKMLTRVIPMTISFWFLPLSMIAWALGFSRAIDKILIPVLVDPGSNYNEFIKRMLLSSFKILEGDYKMFMEKDWFYDAIGISYHLKNLIKIEHLVKFAHDLAHIIEKEDPNKVVPPKYVQTELKKWIKINFEVDIL